MNRIEAENYVYASYLKAEPDLNYDDQDAGKRKPELSGAVIRQYAGTPCVTVTGSKGKGSVANMIAAILQTEMKTGLMTSPHLLAFNERFRVDGQMISDEMFVRTMEKLKESFDEIQKHLEPGVYISPIGIQAALALNYFRDEGTQFNVFEYGKGVKYDDVNQIEHPYAVINTIFEEHTRELGATLRDIAENKSTVMTGNQRCVYVARQHPEVMQIIEQKAAETHTPLKIYGRDFYVKETRYSENGMDVDLVIEGKSYEHLKIFLLGQHQAENLALAMAFCMDILKQKRLSEIRKQLEALRWPGRLELISKEPVVILDACIHRESCKEIKRVLAQMHIDKAAVIIGIPDDKDYAGVAKAMAAYTDKIILTRSSNRYYQFTNIQGRHLSSQGIETITTEHLGDALRLAETKQCPIIILGTTSLVTDMKRIQCSNSLLS